MKAWLLVALVACGGDVNPPVADAPDNAPACTGATYDNCNANADCTSNNCKLFEGDDLINGLTERSLHGEGRTLKVAPHPTEMPEGISLQK